MTEGTQGTEARKGGSLDIPAALRRLCPFCRLFWDRKEIDRRLGDLVVFAHSLVKEEAPASHLAAVSTSQHGYNQRFLRDASQVAAEGWRSLPRFFCGARRKRRGACPLEQDGDFPREDELSPGQMEPAGYGSMSAFVPGKCA